jgi:WXG100 family type VII secretion target
MGAAFTVDLDELRDVVVDLARCGAALDALLDDLAGRVQRLHLTWCGEAAAAQAVAQAEWESGFREMRAALGAMRAAAETAHASYSAAVGANVRMWGGLAAGPAG